MPRIERNATVVWEGNVARGEGHITAGTGAFTALPYTLAARIATSTDKTSPEELLAAAHAACLTTSIATELTKAGTPPVHLEVACQIVMNEIPDQGHQIVESHITISGDEVPEDLLMTAHQGCPFSTLLRNAGVEVTLNRA